MNEIFHEDCLDTITNRNIKYDYTCFSPPDYDELNLTPIKDDNEYLDWQKNVYSKLNPMEVKVGEPKLTNSKSTTR